MVSRQRRWQIKKIKEGLCEICGKKKIYKGDRCLKHYNEHKKRHREPMREYMRKKTGYYERRNNL